MPSSLFCLCCVFPGTRGHLHSVPVKYPVGKKNPKRQTPAAWNRFPTRRNLSTKKKGFGGGETKPKQQQTQPNSIARRFFARGGVPVSQEVIFFRLREQVEARCLLVNAFSTSRSERETSIKFPDTWSTLEPSLELLLCLLKVCELNDTEGFVGKGRVEVLHNKYLTGCKVYLI